MRPGDVFLVGPDSELVGSTYLVTRVESSSGCTDDGQHRWDVVTLHVLLAGGATDSWSDRPSFPYFDDRLLARAP